MEQVKRALASAAAALALAAVASFPAVLSLRSRLVGHEHVDVWNHAWGAWWFWSCFREGRLPLETELLGAPLGGRLWFVDPVGALVTSPVAGLWGVVPAWNLAVIFHLAVVALAGRELGRSLGAGSSASWLAAAGLACSPYLVSEVHNGVSEAVAAGWGVLCLALLVRLLDAPTWSRSLALGACAALTTLTPYAVLGTATAGGVLLVGLGWSRRDTVRLWGPRLLLAGALAAGAAAGVARTVAWTVAEDALIHRPSGGTLREAYPILAHNAVDPRTFFVPGLQSVDLAAQGEAFLHSSYLGWVALGLAVASRRWWALGAAAAALVFSLGPFLYLDGAYVGAPHSSVPLPYRLLFEVLPASALGHPQRVGLAGIALVLGCAAVGLERVPARSRTLVAALAVTELLWSGPWPVARAPALDVRAAAHLAEQAAGPRPAAARGRPVAAVLDLPAEVGRTMATSRYLVLQTVHGLPIPYRPDVRANTAAIGGVAAFQALVGQSPGGTPRPGQLAEQGVRWVVVHHDLGGDTSAAVELLTDWFGPPEVVGDAWIYDTLRAAR